MDERNAPKRSATILRAMLKKLAIMLGGGLLGLTTANAMTWVLAGKWFTPFWWWNLALFLPLMLVCIRYPIAAICRSIEEEAELHLAGLIERIVIHRKVAVVLYFAPDYFGWLTATIILALGMFMSGEYARSQNRAAAYAISALTLLVFALVGSFFAMLNKIRAIHEWRVAERVESFYQPELGRKLLKGARAMLIPGALGMAAVICVVPYAIFISTSHHAHLAAVIAVIYACSVAPLLGIMMDAGTRLQTPPPVRAQDFRWPEGSVGLLLRSFTDETKSLGDGSLTEQQFIERTGLLNRRLKLGWAGASLTWIAVAKPGEHLNSAGIQRLALSNDDWQTWVGDAMSKADLIAMMVGDTGSLAWELREICRRNQLAKLRVIIIPQNRQEIRQAFFTALNSATGGQLPMPELPWLNPDIMVYWWEDGLLRQEVFDHGAGKVGIFQRWLHAQGMK